MIDKFLWQTILEEGKRIGISETKGRALIREYLQCKIISYLYSNPKSKDLSFIGGTSLRILRDLDRFSEDLDFDNLKLSFRELEELFENVSLRFKKEKFKIDFNLKKTDDSGIGSFKFKKLLSELGITADKNEKLNIKVNYTTPKIKPETEVSILKRFGFLQPVITNTENYLLSQKIRAAIIRKDPQPRDFYDIVWFLSHRVKPSPKLFSDLEVETEKELFLKLKGVYKKKIKPNIKNFKKRLRPFLLKEENIYYLDIFEKVIAEQTK